MLSFLQYVLALAFATDLDGRVGAPIDWAGALTGLGTGIGVALAAGFFALRIAQAGGEAAARRVVLLSHLGRILSLAAFWVFAQKNGGRNLDAALGVATWPAVSLLVKLAPYLFLRFVWKASLHRAAEITRTGPPRFRDRLAFDARNALLPLAPLVILGGVQQWLGSLDASSAVGRAWLEVQGAPSAAILASLALVGLLMLFLPFALRIAWRAYPMPKGPLRDRFEAYAKRVGLRANDILIWPTGAGHMNAAVIGALPGFRYVFVTDSLIEALPEDELLAVFAHEAGHAKRQHLPLLIGFTSFFAFLSILPAGLGEFLGAIVEPIPPALRILLFVLVFMGLALGWVSRRLEQEADVYALDTTPAAEDGTHPLAKALDRIAWEGGAERERDSWRHFSIARRVAFASAYLADPIVRARYRTRLGLVRLALVAAIVAAVTTAAIRLPRDLAESRTQRSLAELGAALVERDAAAKSRAFAAAARAAVRAARPEEALRWFREAATLGTTPDVLRDWERLLRASGRTVGADLLARTGSGASDMSGGASPTTPR